MLASDIITRADYIIQDATNVRWPQAELLNWLNDGQREVVLYRPDASVANASIALTGNSTKQVLPSGGIRLLDVTRNMGSDGSTPGPAIRIVEREVLDSQLPNWHSQTAVSVIQHFIFDERDPKHFYVFPQPIASPVVQIEAIYSVAPTDCANTGAAISLDTIYGNVLLDYVCYRAFLKDSEFAGNGARAANHYAAFSNSLGLKTKIDFNTSPQSFSPLNPNVAKTGQPA